jgi:hypothetical protein
VAVDLASTGIVFVSAKGGNGGSGGAFGISLLCLRLSERLC